MTTAIASLISDNLHIWTTAVERRSGAGRGGARQVRMRGLELLKSLILELAVRGRLVPQDPNDHPATELVALARARLQDGSAAIGRQKWKPSRPFDAAEQEQLTPAGWALARVNDTGFYINGWAFKPSDWGTSGRPIIRIQNLTNPSVPFNYTTAKFPDEVVVRDGDILVSWSATLATFQWHGDDAILNQHIFRVVPTEVLTNRAYLRLMLEHAIKELAAGEHAHGLVMTHINRGPFLDHIVLIPPLAEQQRIIERFDELMALCDALETDSAAAFEAHQALVETLLATLTASACAADLANNWARLEANFDILFTTERSIDTLKETIFDLAVRGQLVPQDLNDEPVELPEFRQVSQASDWDEKVFQHGKEHLSLPTNWKIAPLAQVSSHIVDCPHTTPKWTKSGELCIRTNQIKPRRLDLSQPNYVSVDTYRERIERLEPAEGDILYIREGGILGVGCRIPKNVKLCLGQRSMLIRCEKVISSHYLEILINSPFIVGLAAEWTTGGAAPRVNMSTVRGYPIPIPPLAEQHRIVAKVDELVSLCNSLNMGLADAAATQIHLANSIVEQAAA